jgi:hypothetical protein
VEGSVALAGASVERGGVLDDEVHHVEGGAGLLGDGVVQAGLRELLQIFFFIIFLNYLSYFFILILKMYQRFVAVLDVVGFIVFK